MVILERKKRQLKISLSAVEIFDYFGSFDEIRYDNPKARSALGSILLAAEGDGAFLKNSKKLTIKVFPEERGGCTICYTTSPKAVKYHRIENEYILEFNDCESLLRACEQLAHACKGIRGSLYHLGEKYRIILKGDIPQSKILSVAYEYAERIFYTKLEKEKTREYWKNICFQTPVRKICGL